MQFWWCIAACTEQKERPWACKHGSAQTQGSRRLWPPQARLQICLPSSVRAPLLQNRVFSLSTTEKIQMRQTREKLKMSLNCSPRIMITFRYRSFAMYMYVVRDNIVHVINKRTTSCSTLFSVHTRTLSPLNSTTPPVVRNTIASSFAEGVALCSMNTKMLLLCNKVFSYPVSFILVYSSKSQLKWSKFESMLSSCSITLGPSSWECCCFKIIGNLDFDIFEHFYDWQSIFEAHQKY